jgi:hypothetical protein
MATVAEKAKPKFKLGRTVITKGAESELEKIVVPKIPKTMAGEMLEVAKAILIKESMRTMLLRHIVGDFGDMCAEDTELQNKALTFEGTDGQERMMSEYKIKGIRFWVITESDRSVTTLLLPEEY